MPAGKAAAYILLLKRQNTGHQDGQYGLPAGKTEAGERPGDAALREVYEECGVQIRREDLRMTGVMQIGASEPSQDERIDFFFEAECRSGTPVNCEPDKCSELAWFPAELLPENTIPFVREAWNRARRGEWYGSYAMGKNLPGESGQEPIEPGGSVK
ncbi:NUDIX domain-containing protein [Saccharibacillus deserti]|uniref:NUDIX domain-containing protein n=1 Tax=Saccharibacillus deserti TaxID=1634444 RepID=UPI00155421F7|nr:NUDIX domain-containing protein [Saccharibacillus deserti]